jgi:hypothetical protein
MSLYRGYEIVKDQKGWWVWLADIRLNSNAFSSETQAMAWIDIRRRDEIREKSANDPKH